MDKELRAPTRERFMCCFQGLVRMADTEIMKPRERCALAMDGKFTRPPIIL